MADGTDVETSVVGREGFHGLAYVLGDGHNSGEAMFQIAGGAWQIDASVFSRIFEADAKLRRTVLRYALFLLESTSQFMGCNRLHPVGERLSRWLLMTHDRTPGDELHLTHEFMAMMLGVRRPAVSVAAAMLERTGFISYRRGRILVLDRGGLERTTCECYDIANASLERLLGYGIRSPASSQR